MAVKAEVVEKGKQDAGLIVNNSFVDGLVAQLKEKEHYGLTFPKDYTYQNELMGAYLILKDTVDRDKKPVLTSCSQVSIANTLMDMVTMGLSMQKKQCYPIAYGGKLNCQPSVYGNTCIARRYGLEKISAMVIYKDDTFKYHIEDAETVIDTHAQDFENINSDNIIGAYAVSVMNNGDKHIEIMNMSQIKKAWSQGFGYKEGSGTHEKFKDQMAMKTVKNRCLKYIIRTYGTQIVNDAYDRSEEVESVDRTSADMEHDIAQNANSVDFDEQDVVDVQSEVIESEKDTVPQEELPPFMKA